MLKVFLAHSKGTPDEFINRLCSGVRHWFLKNGERVEVVSGVQDFNNNIGSDGTFDAWARGVPVRRDNFTGLRVYGVFVVPGREMGKATAQIVQGAIDAQLPVYSLEEVGEDEVELYLASGVREVNARDFIRGWELVVMSGDEEMGW